MLFSFILFYETKYKIKTFLAVMESSTYKINVLSNLAKTRYLSFRRKGKISTTKITQPRLKGPEAGGDRKWPTGSTKPVLTVKR